MGEKLYVTLLFRLSSENQQNFKIDLIRRKKDYYASKPSINYQQMAGAALHKEMNAIRMRIILAGCNPSLITEVFSCQIKMSIMCFPWSYPIAGEGFKRKLNGPKGRLRLRGSRRQVGGP